MYYIIYSIYNILLKNNFIINLFIYICGVNLIYMGKSKRERFEEVASNRVNKLVSVMLQKCSNTYNYEYTEEDVKKMMGVIKAQFDELKATFDRGAKNNEKFKF